MPSRKGQRLSKNGRSNSAGIVAAAFDYPHGAVIDWHAHATHQLVFAARGVMNVRTAGGTWVVPPHRALWVPAGVEHRIRTIGSVAMRTLYLRRSPAPELGPRACTVVAVAPLLRELILALVAMPRNGDDRSRAKHIGALLVGEMRTMQTQPLYLPLPRSARLGEVCAAMQDDPGSAKSLAQWAASFGVSAKTLARDFVEEFGMTAAQWRRQLRLITALERLAGGTPVTTVALDLGYSTPSAFTAMFRNALGNTPSAYFE